MTGFELTPKQREVRDTLALAARYALLFGGSRSGKTFLVCYAILTRSLKAPSSRHIIFRNDGVDAKHSIAKDTMPKVSGLAYPQAAMTWREQDGYFLLPNKSEIWIGGLKDKARLDKALGREYATIYLNEASQITYEAFELIKSRLAQVVSQVDGVPLRQKMYIDLNPTTAAHWTYRVFIEGRCPIDDSPIVDHDTDYTVSRINPTDNIANLSDAYMRSLESLSERQRRRFLDGQYTADDDNALWSRKMITVDEPPELERIVVAVDPAVTSGVGSDQTGIVVCGRDAAGRAYVLEDESGKYKPDEWARRVVSLYDTYDADCVVAEVNQGGEMVAQMVAVAAKGRTIPVKSVTATRGKHVRAEPIAALYEQGKVRHAKHLPELEDQMCSFIVDPDARRAQGYSPDRVDALVWGMTELFPSIIAKSRQVVAPSRVKVCLGHKKQRR